MFDPTTLVGFHTWLSLVAIAAGFPVASALLRGELVRGWTGLFLVTAIATSATGFLFPVTGVLPSHLFGVVSLVLLAFALVALRRDLRGGWARVYAISTMISFYLLVFVAVVQAFLKVPALRATAPTQSEPPFAVAHGLLFVAFAAVTFLATRRFGAVRSLRL